MQIPYTNDNDSDQCGQTKFQKGSVESAPWHNGLLPSVVFSCACLFQSVTPLHSKRCWGCHICLKIRWFLIFSQTSPKKVFFFVQHAKFIVAIYRGWSSTENVWIPNRDLCWISERYLQAQTLCMGNLAFNHELYLIIHCPLLQICDWLCGRFDQYNDRLYWEVFWDDRLGLKADHCDKNISSVQLSTRQKSIHGDLFFKEKKRLPEYLYYFCEIKHL